MKIDFDKDNRLWSIRKIETDELTHQAKEIVLRVPSRLVLTNGGRHGYLVTAGQVNIDGDTATITKG